MTDFDLDALLQGAIDNTLTAEEQARLTRMIDESVEARDRAAQFEQLTGFIESAGPAIPPPGLVEHVLAQVSNRPYPVRPSTFERGVTVNKKILFGLATAAAIFLAVVTFNSYPRPTEGTEATIGAAQRAQAPQIAAQDVKLGDTSTQDVLQSETFDAIMKDAAVRTMLQDAALRLRLQDAAFQKALQDDGIKKALLDPGFTKKLLDPALNRALVDPEMAKKFNDANIVVMLSNRAFADALRDPGFRNFLSNNVMAAALAGPAFQKALLDKGFNAAIRSQEFVAHLR